MAFDDAPLTVSELNRRARLAVEGGLPLVWVLGEVSGFTRAPSGHWYFTLRDATASVRCAMFRNRNQFVDWLPGNGAQVEVRAQPTLYEARGEFQLTVEVMRHAGLGALYEALARLKARLEQEGLFDPARKRPLPALPTRIGVVTSARAAALRDVLITLRRRWPLARVFIYPTAVQGEGAGAAIAARIHEAGAAGLCQVLLVVRGGGGLQDLWAFNDEAVVRAIAACPVPVVSGVGHETDFCLADFAADLRAPTPTAAAQLATPDAAGLRARAGQQARLLTARMRQRLQQQAQRLDAAAARLRHPAARLAEQGRRLTQSAHRLELAWAARMRARAAALGLLETRLRGARPRPAALVPHLTHLRQRLAGQLGHELRRQSQRLDALTEQLRQLNPEAVLARGYCIARDGTGRVISDSAQVAVGDVLSLTLRKGEVDARVEGTRRRG